MSASKPQRLDASALVVEASPAVAGTLRRALESVGLTVRAAHSAEEAITAIESTTPDLVVIGWSPHFEGESLCSGLKESHPQLPVVLFYPPEVDDPTAHALRVGADAFLVAPLKRPNLFSTTQLLLRLRALNQKHSEPLPSPEGDGASSQEASVPLSEDLQAFKRALVMELRRAKRYGAAVSLLMAGFDEPEKVFAQYPATSQFWGETQNAIHASLRDIDVVARLSDGRFLILLPQTPQEGAEVVASRILEKVGSPHPLDGWTASVGVATCQPQGDEGRVGLTALMKYAQQALTQARLSGGNRIECLSSRRSRKERIALT